MFTGKIMKNMINISELANTEIMLKSIFNDQMDPQSKQ